MRRATVKNDLAPSDETRARATLCATIKRSLATMAQIHPTLLRLSRGATLVLDGGTSAALARHGYHPTGPLRDAPAARDAPDVLATVHREFADAGVDLLTAWTASTSARALARGGFGMRAAAITHRAMDLAAEEAASADHPILVASALGPLGIERDRLSMRVAHDEHKEQVARIASGGGSLCLIESMPTFEETLAATSVAAVAIPETWVTLSLDAQGALLDGTDLTRAVRGCSAVGARLVILSAATMGPLHEALERAQTCASGVFVGVRVHVTQDTAPERFASSLGACITRGAHVVGGSGHVTGAHVRALSEFVRARRAA
jgi:methionine synthase I (cobalamin-dependent)